MVAYIFIVVVLLADGVRVLPANTVPEVCNISRKYDNAMVFKVTAFSGGRWGTTDASIHAILVECAVDKKK